MTMQRLKQELDDIMVNGMEDFPALLTIGTKREDDEECFQIEDSWRCFVDNFKQVHMTKKQIDHQDAIWKIIKTEVAFIKDIRIIVDFYLCTLLNLQASVILNEIETESVFSNIVRIESLHTRFWKERLSPMVNKAREERKLLWTLDLARAFEGFSDLFAPYSTYSITHRECAKYLKDNIKRNEMFRYFVEWAQKHPRSRRCKLADLLECPIRRITKYPFLLVAVSKTTLDDQCRAEVSTVASEVRSFVRGMHQVSNMQEDEEEKIAVEDEVCATLNPKSPTLTSRAPGLELMNQTSVPEVPKLVQLQTTLDELMADGLQDFPGLLMFSAKKEDGDEDLFNIEGTWRTFADKETLDELDGKEIAEQEAIWEIVTSEIDFIKDIRVIVNLYLCTLFNLQASMLLNEIETEKIFRNITAIEETHTRFWKEKLSSIIKRVREGRRLPSKSNVAESFKDFAQLFAPYIKFCSDRNSSMEYLMEQVQTNEMFSGFLDWAERHPDSRDLKLQDLLDYPIQRISKYPLLLTALAQADEDHYDAELMLRITEVKEFVMRVNPAPSQKNERDENIEVHKMLKLQQTLDDFLVHGLQDFSSLLGFGPKRVDDRDCVKFVETWREYATREFVGIDRMQADQQKAIWEIIHSEDEFIKDIRVVVDLYLPALLNLQASLLMNEIETERIFRNFSAIEDIHTKFLKSKLSKVVRQAMAQSRILSAVDLADAFEGLAKHFAPYLKYCAAQDDSMTYLRQQIKDNERFRYFVDWAQKHPDSRGLRLLDLLDYPVQRVNKYPLLLGALENTLDSRSRSKVSTRTSEVAKFAIRLLPNSMQDEKKEETTETNGVKGTLQRAVAFKIQHFGSSKKRKSPKEPEEIPKSIQLQMALQDFMDNGLQDFPCLMSFSPKKEDEEEFFDIEGVCYEYADKDQLSDLERKQSDQQDALWEIITTEIGFIKDIRIIMNLYMCTLLNLQGAMLLNDIETEKIFGNIVDIEDAHTRFWKKKLSKIVGRARGEKRLPTPVELAEAFVGFSSVFSAYNKFCSTHRERARYLNNQIITNEMFEVFLDWAQRHPDSFGPSLGDLLDYPIERIAKYPNLLSALEKTLDGQERAVLSPRIAEVKAFVSKQQARL